MGNLIKSTTFLKKWCSTAFDFGTLLYIIYKNVLPEVIQENFVLYADETSNIISAINNVAAADRIDASVSELRKCQ